MHYHSHITIPEAIEEMAIRRLKKLGAHDKSTSEGIEYHVWPETFASTAGPRGGIGGCAMTTFEVIGFVSTETMLGVMFCNGEWRDWDGVTRAWRWEEVKVLEARARQAYNEAKASAAHEKKKASIRQRFHEASTDHFARGSRGAYKRADELLKMLTILMRDDQC